MSNNTIRSNGLLIAVILYVSVFGLKINLGGSSNHSLDPSYIPIVTPVIDPPPTLPLIQKEHLENKTYVIKVLINHIDALNLYIESSNKNSNEALDKYNKCVGG